MTSGFGSMALALVQQAALAPSSHNTQPWRFRARESAIDVFGDRTRALPVNDPDDRELTISCDAALLNLRVAAAHHGVALDLQLLPDADDPDWLARASLGTPNGGMSPDGGLFACIGFRRTYRKRFAPRMVESSALGSLMDAASIEGAYLRPIVAVEARRTVAGLGERRRCRTVGQPELATRARDVDAHPASG